MINDSYAALAIAILAEVIGTSALKSSDGFEKLLPAVAALSAYGVSLYCLSFAIKSIPVGIVYAVWAGSGILLVTAVGWLVFRQPLDAWAIIGLGLIMAGLIIVSLFSTSAPH